MEIEMMSLQNVISERDRLRKALYDLVLRCDGAEGVRADGSNIDTSDAHYALGHLFDKEQV